MTVYGLKIHVKRFLCENKRDVVFFPFLPSYLFSITYCILGTCALLLCFKIPLKLGVPII